MSSVPALSIEDITAARRELGQRIVTTPVHEWESPAVAERIGAGTRVFLKLELFQRSGSFKARAALLNMLRLDRAQRERGVTAISAGNHAIAVAYGAHALATHAKVVMLASANPELITAIYKVAKRPKGRVRRSADWQSSDRCARR